MKRRRLATALSIVMGMAGALALLWLLGRPGTALVVAASDVSPSGIRERRAPPQSAPSGPSDATPLHYVAITGTDSGDCGTPVLACRTVQYAVDVAAEGDQVLVSTGVYSGLHSRTAPPGYPGPNSVVQVVFVEKSLTLRGGYSTTDWSSSNPVAFPTTLDAQGGGRALFLASNITTTVEGLRITGGDADGLRGGFGRIDAGGGVYAISATAAISGSWVFSNSASAVGGLYLHNSTGKLKRNIVSSNASNAIGGGLFLFNSSGQIVSSTFSFNASGPVTASDAAGLGLLDSQATVAGNIITSNVATGLGGGVFVWHSDAVIYDNSVAYNTADEAAGFLVFDSNAAFFDNRVVNNTGHVGSGAFLVDLGHVVFVGNTVQHNSAAGIGGLSLTRALITFSNNVVVSNVADYVGALAVASNSHATFENNVIADNLAKIAYAGLYIEDSSADFVHNTFARNIGGNGTAIHVGNLISSSVVPLVNTILVSHTVGISVTEGNTARLDGTLWANESDWGGPGTIFTGNVNFWGDPGFLDADEFDYHIGPNSVAIDAGVPTFVTTDIDGDPRPIGLGRDIGADEFLAALYATKQASPRVVQPGGALTYTLHVTNTGLIALNTTITDLLPDHVTPSGVLSWTAVLSPDGTWSREVSVTVEVDYVGPLTNVLRATSLEGADSAFTHTLAPDLALTKVAEPAVVEPGARLTYTLRLTNSGDYHLQAIVTDHLPLHVMPTGSLTWMAKVDAPGGVWSQTVVVTAGWGYVGPLTNVVQASATGGVRGVHAVTTILAHVAGATFAPDRSARVDPGNVIGFVHTLANTGNLTDTFDLTHHSSQGWWVTVTTPITAGHGQTSTVLVTINVPWDAIRGTLDRTAVTATSRVDPTVWVSVTDRVTVGHVPGVMYSPDQASTVNPEGTAIYAFTLVNGGNGPDIIDLGHHSSQGWPVSYATPVTVGYGQTATVVVSVTLPAGSGGLSDVTHLTATSHANPGVNATSVATTTSNVAPRADAGPDRTVVTGEWVTLDGSDSADPDGHVPLTYDWMQEGESPVALVGADTAQATFLAPQEPGVLTFTLTVTDALRLASAADGAVVTVLPANRAPFTPINPVPLPGATGVPLTQTLRWQGGDPDGDPVTYAVAFGVINPPPVVTTTTVVSYTPVLTYSRDYYWAITASDGTSATPGPLWGFTTVDPTRFSVYLPLLLRN